MQIIDQCRDLATNPKHTRWISPLLLLADAALCALIIWKIPCFVTTPSIMATFKLTSLLDTEIDWKAYMQQVEQYINGERDYTKIKGGTGALVYPAAHVYTYRILYFLTDQGRDILRAQCIFTGVYLVTLAVVMACYQRAKAPPYVFPLLILSKRLHSIFLLRCFNDCFAVCALFVAIYAYQRRMWTLGSIVYSWGLGIKMSLLLALPAIGIILLQALGRERALRQAVLMGQLQVLIALPFLRVNAKGYLSRAFEFTRQFLYKWTVNWRFVDEDVFLSKPFSLALLAAHVCLLVLFVVTRWTRPSQRSLLDTIRMVLHQPPASVQQEISRRVTPEYILTTILTANAIGMLCARSLHYQFYSWIAWATPFLLWRAGFHPVLQYAIWAAQEWAWNVYPSTDASSMTVVGVLVVTVLGAWWGTRKDYPILRQQKVPQRSHVE